MRLSVSSILAPFALGLFFATAPLPLATLPAFAKAHSSRKAAPKAVVKAPPVAPDVVQAPSWVLLDPETGRVLEEKNAHQRMFPASTTKTMTALLAIESGKLDEVFTIGPNPPKTGEQSINLMQGERFLLHDLVRAALIKSANDSCVAIAEAVAGDVPTFVKMMNEKAKEIGAKDTHFCNPHGLHNSNHYTTAYDLGLIAQAAMRHPEFNEITRTKEAAIHGNWKIGPSRPLVNRNRLLLRWNPCDGVKTGYTRQAGRCLIASATQIDASSKEPWRLLCVVLHAPDSWHDAQALLQYHGFAHFEPFLAARSGEEIDLAPVQNGAKATAILPQDAVLTLRQGEQNNLTRQVQWNPLSAPLQAGQTIGQLAYFANGEKVAALPLVAQNDVPVSRLTAVMPSHLKIASPFKGHYLSFLKWPTAPNLMVFGALFLGVLLIWSGLSGGSKSSKSGRKQSHEKPKQPARRAAPNPTPHPKNPDSPDKPGRRNPNAADASRPEPSARNQQPHSATPQRTTPQRTTPTRSTKHSRAARQAEQSRHSAPGSVHQERRHSERQTKDQEQPSIGAQFIERFLDEENENQFTEAESPRSRW